MAIFAEREIGLELTPAASSAISALLAAAPVKEPLLAIQWASSGAEEKWVLGTYERQDFREGWIGRAAGMEFGVIQEWILDLLDKAILDYDQAESRIIVNRRDSREP